MIKKVLIHNFKIFEQFEIDFNNTLNIIVGDNESGKSTILEAINLALTKRLNGRFIEYELTPYIFNKKCEFEYLESLKSGKGGALPKIIIEVYLDDNPELQSLRGSMNTKREDCIGIKLEIVFDDDYKAEYEKLIEDPSKIKTIPSEYYKIQWYSFANEAITLRSLPIRVSYIDATTIRLQSGTDYYFQEIVKNDLDIKERVGLNMAYRNLKEIFSQQPSIKGINDKLISKKGAITDKKLSISIDISQKTNWEASLIPHLDELPFQLIGKGEQNALKIMLALENKANEVNIVLIEEPENHLSFSSMSKLIHKICEKCEGKQLIITTHSAYVLNKLGLENLILLCNNVVGSLKKLDPATYKYFKKLPGYDTLRLILSKKAILVEGPSDELIIQKAYDLKHNKLPLGNGVDVISVGGLSFSRFLEIAKLLKKEVIVVTDNDGDYKSKVEDKYSMYLNSPNIKFCYSKDNSASSLEPQLIKSNSLAILNKVFGKDFKDLSSLQTFMESNKTECALKLLETSEVIKYPEYVEEAINQE